MNRPHARFLLMGAVILVMALVNGGSFLLVRGAGQTLHQQATLRSLAAGQLKFDIADMNGAQNLYLIAPAGGRGVFLAAQRRLGRSIAASARLSESAGERQLLARIQTDYQQFRSIDARVWSALQSGQPALARVLAAGPETAVYNRMAGEADRLQSDTQKQRIAALDTYNSRQRIALVAVLLLDGVALLLTVMLLFERLRTGRRLDTREAEFETLLAELPAAVRIHDRDRGRLSYANQRYLTMFGYTRAQLDSDQPLGWQDHLHPHDRDRVLDGWRAAAASGASWNDRYRWLVGDGAHLWIADSELSMPGRPELRLGIALDVTSEQDAVHELDHQRRRYRTLVERMPLVVYIDSLGARQTLYVSPQVQTVLGISEREWVDALGTGFWEERVHPDDRARVRQAVSERNSEIALDHTSSVRYRLRRPDGEYRWIESEEIEVAGDDGQPLWRQGLIRDIHEQVLAQDRYQDLIDRLPGTVALWDKGTSSTTFVSAHIEQLTGEPAERWLGREGYERYRAQVHPDDLVDPERWRSDGLPSTYRWRRSDGREIWIREIDAPSPETESGVGVLLFDATAEMNAQIELRAAERKSLQSLAALVTAAEEERSRIATELHDDTVSDLTAVLIHVRMQMRRDPSLEPFERVLSAALERTRRLMFELRPHVLAHEGLQAAIEQTVRHSPIQHPWQSEVQIEVPRQSDTIEALAYRAIRELVLNARKHSRADTITVQGRERDGVLEFVVEDDGVGFDQQDVRNREGAFLHIGLATTRERIELAGGSFDVASAPGQGARFTITLPAQPREAGAAVRPMAGEAV
jgi:PAS domain S-box-containing protein